MNQIDITVKKVCDYCHIELSFHHPYEVGLLTMSEHTTVTLRIYDTFVNCPNCERPLYLRIQGHPYDIHNHLDSPVAVYLARQMDEDAKRLAETPTEPGMSPNT